MRQGPGAYGLAAQPPRAGWLPRGRQRLEGVVYEPQLVGSTPHGVSAQAVFELYREMSRISHFSIGFQRGTGKLGSGNPTFSSFPGLARWPSDHGCNACEALAWL